MVENIHPIFDQIISREEKESFLKQRAAVLWLTGLSGSGKSTLARALEQKLQDAGYFSKLLDGDNIRTGLNNNLGFSLEDRKENIRRISETARLFLDGGVITLCSFVSPTKEIRDMAASIIGEKDFLEVYVNAPIEVCEQRDVKGLYKKVRAGEIKGFTGIDSPFEAPEAPFVEIRTHEEALDVSAEKLFQAILEKINIK